MALYFVLAVLLFMQGVECQFWNAQTYSFKLGSFMCKIVSDGQIFLPWDSFYSSQYNQSDYQEVIDFYHQSEMWNAYINTVYCETGEENILVDTGCLTRFFPESAGKQYDILVNAGIDPNKIDKVVLTHGHIDHFSGLITDDKVLQYPNSQIWIPKADFEFYTNRSNSDVLFFEEAYFVFTALQEVGADLVLFEEGPLFEGFEAIDTSGHSPGHSVIKVSSEGEELYITGDTLFSEVSIGNPNLLVGFDMDMDKGVDSRLKLFRMAAEEGALVAAYHVTFPGLGWIQQVGDSFQWITRQWEF
eukprot:TRINITY_DN5056_c1_g1_i3.p1 TRINITY_DN5056_c1_g1~~TRINITY_DN5056_c1_g1_i3.p1  ORF type:complete len:325 (-),score=38.19 TRINITY_DN5056_c1_g1_i3:144-1049(-)